MISFVYVIGIEDNPVKVGLTDDLRKRLQLLQIGCPDELRVFHVLEFPRFAVAGIEAAAHRALKEHHRRGEWFNVSADTARSVVERVAPAVVETETETRRSSGNLFIRLQEYGLHPWAQDAMGFYRICRSDPSRARDLELMNARILKVAGIPGLEVFKIALSNPAHIGAALYRDPSAERRAEKALARAINALAHMYCQDRERSLIDKIQENAA